MSVSSQKNRVVQILEHLTERLSAPDLTAAESRDLRPRLLGLLETIEGDRASGTTFERTGDPGSEPRLSA